MPNATPHKRARARTRLVSVCFGILKPLLSSDPTRYKFNFPSLYSIHGTCRHFFYRQFNSEQHRNIFQPPHNECAHAHILSCVVGIAFVLENLYFISSQQKVEQILIHCVISLAFECIRVEPKCVQEMRSSSD